MQKEEFEVDLMAKLESLDQLYQSQIKERVDAERRGRLAKLEVLDAKINVVEDVAVKGYDQAQHAIQRGWILSLTGVLKEKLKETSFVKNDWLGLAKASHNDEFVKSVVDSVSVQDLESYKTAQHLYAFFNHIEADISRAQFIPAQAGLFSFLFGTLLSYLVITPSWKSASTLTSAILSRAKYHLDHGEVDSAARELNSLKGWSRVVVDDWLRLARIHCKVVNAVDVCWTYGVVFMS